MRKQLNVLWFVLLAMVVPVLGDQAEVDLSTLPANRADSPQFDNKTLWPTLSGKEDFVKSQWDKGQLLIWRYPGRNGGPRRRNSLDVTKASSWIDAATGKPPAKVVLGPKTDLLFPASEQKYAVGFRGTKIREICRHVTIESGAGFCGGGDGVGRNIYGNVWVKAGGGMDSQGATRFLGEKSVFFRNDNILGKTTKDTGRGGGIMSSQYFTFEKSANASIEFLGHVSVLDEFRINGCTVIVGVDSKLQPGRNAVPGIDKGGRLVLLDGAVWESWNNDFGTPELVVQNGTVQGGLPERPLTRNCKLGLAHKNYTAADYQGKGGPRRKPGRTPGLVMLKGELKTISTDPAKARLIIGTMENDAITPEPDSDRWKAIIGRRPETENWYRFLMKLPKGNDVYIGKGVTVKDVTFMDIRKGGMLYTDQATKKMLLENATFQDCAAEGESLFTNLPKGLNRQSY